MKNWKEKNVTEVTVWRASVVNRDRQSGPGPGIVTKIFRLIAAIFYYQKLDTTI